MTRLPRLSLSLTLPLALALAVLVLVAASIAASAAQLADDLRSTAEAHLRSVAHGLSLEVGDHPVPGSTGSLWLHAAHISTDPRVSAVALIGPDGRIRAAHRRAWFGRLAGEVWPDMSLQPAADLHAATVQWSDDRTRLAVQIGYVQPEDGEGVRNLQHGSIVIAADLRDELAGITRQAVLQRLPELVTSAILMLLLGLWLHLRVTLPLAALEAASRQVARDDLSVRTAETGPAEIARLAHSFNQMAEALGSAHAELRASEDRLSTILYSTGDALMVTDAQQRVTLLNRIAERLTGWTEREALGRPVTQVFRIENADTGLPAELPITRVLADGVIVGLANHTVLISRDGSRCHIADSAAPVRRADGSLTGVVLVFRDVSAAYQLERALADNEWHYRTLANSGRALVWTSDRDGHNTWCNDLWRQYTGQSAAETAGTGWLAAVHPDDRAPFQAALAAAQERQQPCSIELRLRHADGSYRWMLNDAAPRHDSTGRYIGYIGHCLDISSQRETQLQLQGQLDELRRLHTALIGREERVAELKQEVNVLLQAHGQPARYGSTPRSLLP